MYFCGLKLVSGLTFVTKINKIIIFVKITVKIIVQITYYVIRGGGGGGGGDDYATVILTQYVNGPIEVLFSGFDSSTFSPSSLVSQVVGRAIVLFCVVDAEPSLQTSLSCYLLVVAWCAIEVVRYSVLVITSNF